LRPQKDQLTLIMAFQEVIEKHPEWSLHLVGKDFNDEYASQLKEVIALNRLENNIFLHGSRNDVAGILSSCDIGVLSSISEGLPVALLEYGLYQLPVIATRVGACEEVIGEDGQLVAPGQVNELSTAILTYMEDKENRQQRASRFHEKIVAQYGKEQYLAQLMEIYKQL
jgi:glycosyltransferase involved in cell wall biosynthesis